MIGSCKRSKKPFPPINSIPQIINSNNCCFPTASSQMGFTVFQWVIPTFRIWFDNDSDHAQKRQRQWRWLFLAARHWIMWKCVEAGKPFIIHDARKKMREKKESLSRQKEFVLRSFWKGWSCFCELVIIYCIFSILNRGNCDDIKCCEEVSRKWKI